MCSSLHQRYSSLWFLIKKCSQQHLFAFTDADWAGCPDDHRSTGGSLIYLGQNLLGWTSRKQPTVVRSSTESEFRAIADVCVELLWLRHLLTELGALLVRPPHVWCDNLGAVFLASNPVFHARTRHVEVDYHFVRSHVLHKHLTVGSISASDQVADILTKPLAKPLFQRFLDKLRLVHCPPSACGGVSTNISKSSNR